MPLVTFGSPSRSDLEYVAFNMRDDDATEIFGYLPHDNPYALAATAAHWINHGHWGMCAYSDGVPVAVVGLFEWRSGVFEGWCYATDAFPFVARPLTKFLKQEIASNLRKAGAHRVYAVSRFDHLKSHRWLELLGFTVEGVEKMAGKDRADYYRYAVTN